MCEINSESFSDRVSESTCFKLAFTLKSVASKMVRKRPSNVHKQTSDCKSMPTYERMFIIVIGFID